MLRPRILCPRRQLPLHAGWLGIRGAPERVGRRRRRRAAAAAAAAIPAQGAARAREERCGRPAAPGPQPARARRAHRAWRSTRPPNPAIPSGLRRSRRPLTPARRPAAGSRLPPPPPSPRSPPRPPPTAPRRPAQPRDIPPAAAQPTEAASTSPPSLEVELGVVVWSGARIRTSSEYMHMCMYSRSCSRSSIEYSEGVLTHQRKEKRLSPALGTPAPLYSRVTDSTKRTLPFFH